MKIITAKGRISDAFRKVIQWIDDWVVTSPSFCWFRGCTDNSLSLQPGAYWRKEYTELEPLVDFVQRGVAFADVGNLDRWDTYYLAQHHRLPTRLLDWTESFAAALFFAFDGWDGEATPCVWILQPGLLNKVFLDWDGVVTPENNSETDLWLPKEIAKTRTQTKRDKDGYVYNNRFPLAIFPKGTNRRIVAQQGMFTVHGREQGDLRQLVTQRKSLVKVKDLLARLDLEGFKKKRVDSSLATLGVRRSAIYPDIDNFVRELKDYFDW